MLVLTRKVGERIQIGDQIVVTVVRIHGTAVRLGVEAPPDCVVVRQELAERALAATKPECEATAP